jgi:hypothetical protein
VLFDRLEEAFKGTPNATLVNDLYQGRMVDYLDTIGYAYSSTRATAFLDMSLQVKAFGSDHCFRSVDESLRSFLAPERLDGDNQYYCEEAQQKFDAIKGFRLERLPYLLTLQLKRFDLDYSTFQRVKLNDQVRFPRVLNMNPFVAKPKDDNGSPSSSAGAAVAAAGEGGNGAAAAEPTSAASGADGAAFERLAFERGVLLERERLLSTTPPPAADDAAAASLALAAAEEELPDLVDVSGVPHPEVASEAAAAAKEALAAARAERFPEDDEDVDPVAVAAADGEWVYELYAVLVHSGSALGGHYYAYIKHMVSRPEARLVTVVAASKCYAVTERQQIEMPATSL